MSLSFAVEDYMHLLVVWPKRLVSVTSDVSLRCWAALAG